jgi:transposase
VQRRTIYSWLKRLETEPLEQAVQDDHRSERPRKLTEEQQKQLEQTLQQPSTESEVDAPASTPALLKDFLEETFDVDYSIPSCRRLMKEAGLSYQKPRRTAAEDRDEFRGELKKSDERWTPR